MTNIKSLFFLGATCILFSAAPVIAQTSSSITGGDPEPLERTEYSKSADASVLTTELLRDASAVRSEISLQQIGDGNNANIDVNSAQTSGNTIEVIQSAGRGAVASGNANNVAELRVQGGSNNISIEQYGQNNRYEGNVRATGLRQEVVQEGSNNVIEQGSFSPDKPITLIDNAEIIITQFGDGNELDASSFSVDPNAANSGLETPVRVTQQGGARARVTVTPR